MVNQVSTAQQVTRQLAEVLRPATDSATSAIADDTTESFSHNSVTLSSLAQQLSDSASRADAQYAGLSHKEFGATATALLSKITGTLYSASRTINDAEVPDSTDPERLARAKQATAFVNGNGQNPFAGLSRDQLALITYDDSGLYTTNERRAAWEEASDQEYAWRQKAVAQAMAEYNSSGKLTDFFSNVLEHYKSLPAIEQAQYPQDYEATLEKWIELDYNYLTNQAEGKGHPLDAVTLQRGLAILQ